MESIVGKILSDRYRIIRELSQDDFSTLYAAEDLANVNSPQCQIERLQPQYESEVLGTQSWQKVLQAFVEQGNVLKKISQHPQIPQLLAFFECDRQFYLVQELFESETLEQRLERSLIDEAEAIEWLQEILRILEFIHQANVAHLNIQPSSLIQHQDGRKFLTNFAAIKNSILFKNKSLQTIVNQDFAAPEQIEGKADFTTDVYALGKTIIYALTKKVSEFIQPKTPSPDDTQQASTSNTYSSADIDSKLASILNKMVEKKPSLRYQSAAEVIAELDFEQQNVVVFPPPFALNPQSPQSSGGEMPFTVMPKSRKQIRSKSNSRFKFSKRIIWSLLALPFIIALIIIFIGMNKNAYQGFVDYVNNYYQFKLKYPQTWSKRDLDDPITGEVVVFASPLENNADLFLEKVSIAVEYLPSKSTTLEQYGQTVFKRIKQDKANNIEIDENRQTKIDEFPARMIVYSRQERGLQLRQMEVFTIKNKQVYIAIYTAEKAKYSKFLETAEKIIDSWEIN